MGTLTHYDLYVIYAEDEPKIRDSVSKFLIKFIFPNLLVAENGFEALKIYKEYAAKGIIIDLVITDITMPVMDGFQFIENARLINEDLFALIVSGLDFGPYFSSINNISVRTQYVNKPVDLVVLLGKLKDLIHKIDKNKALKSAQNLAEQYKLAIDSSALVTKADKDGNITFVNEQFCKLLGYTEDELLGKNHKIIKAPFVSTEIFKELWETIKSKKIYKYENLPIRSKNGKIFYMQTTIFPITNIDGEIVEYLSIRFDNTKLMNSLEEEKKAKETQALFLANMSHEIRTPLNAIIGFTKLLSELKLEEQERNFVSIINDNAQLLVKTIGEILDFTKIRSGKMDLEFIYFNPVKEFTSIKDLFFAVASQKNVKLKLNIDSKLNHVLLYSDITKIKQVISNLLSNAIKFTPEHGNVLLAINVEKIEDEVITVNFIVKDSGIGIEEEKLEEIFKPFTQENQSTTRQYGGTGLGLSICKEIANLLNTQIKVVSDKNSGSVFSFKVSMQSKVNKEILNNHKENISFNDDCHILIAEDVDINQKLIDALLKKVGLKPKFVDNGKQAVDYFIEHHETIDLIFLDINMPIMDGVEALKNINRLQMEYKTKTPIVALTANAVKGDKEKFLRLGFDSYISKPINFEFLVAVLKLYLKHKSIIIEETQEIQKIEEKKVELTIDLESIAQDINLPYDFYLELLGDFNKKIDYEVYKLENYIEKDSTSEIQNQAHKLKGLCGNLGFTKLYNIFKDLESFENKDKALSLIEDSKKILELIKKESSK